MRVLVAGWFSFPQMGATAGDLLTRDLVCTWLAEAGRPFDVAVAPPFEPGVRWEQVDPEHYATVVFVCGPFGNGWPIPEFLGRFAGRRLIGVNLSMLDPLEVWNPFDVLLERDSSAAARPDLTFLTTAPRVPIVGVVLVHDQHEYRQAAHGEANGAIERLLAARAAARVPIDTRLDVNGTGLRTASEVESVISRMDLVVTTRLHGLVLALKNGVPALAIDPIRGGAKLVRQAASVGWPMCFAVDAVDDARLAEAFDYGLTPAAGVEARAAAARGRAGLVDIRARFMTACAGGATAR